MRARQSKVRSDEVFGAIYVGNYITVVHFIVSGNKNQVVDRKRSQKKIIFLNQTCRLPGDRGLTMAAIRATGRWLRDFIN